MTFVIYLTFLLNGTIITMLAMVENVSYSPESITSILDQGICFPVNAFFLRPVLHC